LLKNPHIAISLFPYKKTTFKKSPDKVPEIIEDIDYVKSTISMDYVLEDE
jgi:hypothetical protein